MLRGGDGHVPIAHLEEDGWELDDGEWLQRTYPERFRIPEHDLRAALAVGNLVKCRFRILTRDKDGVMREHAERMWVVVRGREGEGYVGELNNQPDCSDRLKRGTPVWFEARHVLAIHEARV